MQKDDEQFDDIEYTDEENTSKSKIDKLKSQIEKLKEEKQEYLDGWQRAKADYANQEKAHSDKMANLTKNLQLSLIEDLFPVLDSFNSAMSNKQVWESVDQNWRVGIEYIHKELYNILSKYNVEEYGSDGDDYNENIHEAMKTEDPTDISKPGTIKVLQKGYKRGDQVIRPAKVIIYK
ncbi:nucleotide exchange factor GrpE [Candidatus Nomurabacteria bacterium]|nr:nucleotide exchange factor GrpE [Candidatus Nomurabacteria bacterium]MCB9820672.1 nucleotide exchange factor GrpE [Candidatus Nomurabacteria bacterium]